MLMKWVQSCAEHAKEMANHQLHFPLEPNSTKQDLPIKHYEHRIHSQNPKKALVIHLNFPFLEPKKNYA